MTASGAEQLSVEERLALAELVELSRSYGSDRELVIGGGGNTSVKFEGHLLVKASGAALETIRGEDFVDLDRGMLQALLESEIGGPRDERESAFKDAVMGARLHPERNQRPSVESVLHHLMPGKFVVHLHSTLVNQFSCSREGRRLVAELGDDVIWVDLVDPGLVLAQALQQGLTRFVRVTGRSCPRAVILQNHGSVVSGDTPREVKDRADWLTAALGRLRERAHASAQAREVQQSGTHLTSESAQALVNAIGPALRALLGRPGGTLQVVTFDSSGEVLELLARSDAREIVMAGPLTPDQIVYCHSFPLWFEPGQAVTSVVARLEQAVREYTEVHRVPPVVVLVPGLGLFASGASWHDAETARLVYVDSIKVLAGALGMGGAHYLPADFREFIEHWEVEAYRRSVAGKAPSA
ncbi:MAG TPA: class II aldolase/adducin family protein [Acidimicrobiales bacterium]|nr:class II aldolase/adducin family protein [Acidimicrobiales bacterium]